MHRLGILGAIGETFRFAFARWPTLIRVAWAPLLVFALALAGLGVALFAPVAGDLSDLALPDDASGAEAYHALTQVWMLAGGRIALFAAVLLPALSLLAAMIAVPMQRLVILGEEPVGAWHLRLDAVRAQYFSVLMMIQAGGLLLFSAIVAGAFLASGGLDWISAIVTAIETETEPSEAATGQLGLFAGIVGALSLPVYFYLAIKFMLALPATAARGEMIVFRSMALTWGNFWRIFAAYLLYTLGIFALAISIDIIEAIVNGVAFLAGSVFGEAGVADGLARVLIGIVAALLLIGLQIIFQAISHMLGYGFPAVVYRRITQGA